MLINTLKVGSRPFPQPLISLSGVFSRSRVSLQHFYKTHLEIGRVNEPRFLKFFELFDSVARPSMSKPVPDISPHIFTAVA